MRGKVTAKKWQSVPRTTAGKRSQSSAGKCFIAAIISSDK